MHVAIVTTSYPDNLPGREAAGSFVADFAHELSRHVRVSIVAAASSSSQSRDQDIEVVRFAVRSWPLSLLNPLSPLDWPAIARTLRSGKQALEDLVQRNRPDLIFALWALPSGHWAATVGGRAGIPYAIWALGSDIWAAGRLPFLRARLRRVLQGASHRFADGLRLAADVERIADKRCRFLASTRRLPSRAVNRKASGPPYNLAFLGRWHRNKGVDLLVGALGMLDDRDWQKIGGVRINGGGPLQDEVRNGVRALRDRDRPVEVGGYVDKAAAADLIAWADYLLIPSRIESIPVVFSDAMQLRTPVIATPVGDLPALHEKHRFGILAKDASGAALKEALCEALGSSAAEFQAGLESAAADFSLSGSVERFLEVACGCVGE